MASFSSFEGPPNQAMSFRGFLPAADLLQPHQILFLLGFVLSCAPSGEFPNPSAELELSPWVPATVAYNPDCIDECPEIGRLPTAHQDGLEVVFRLNSKVDDAIVQWSRCLDSIFDCLEENREIRTCVLQAVCPAYCVVAFEAASSDAFDEEALFAALEHVFVDEDASCLPQEAVRP